MPSSRFALFVNGQLGESVSARSLAGNTFFGRGRRQNSLRCARWQSRHRPLV